MRPEPQDNLREVAGRAFDALAGSPVAEVASSAGGAVHEGSILLPFLGRELVVDPAARAVRDADGRAVSDLLAAVATRYLALAGRLPAEGRREEVGFADVADARGYLAPFKGRVLAPLIARFGRDPEGFSRSAAALGGERRAEPAGASAWTVRVFPRVRMTFVIHPADDELAADGQALFERDLFEAFTVEDIVVMAQMASLALRGRLAPADKG